MLNDLHFDRAIHKMVKDALDSNGMPSEGFTIIDGDIIGFLQNQVDRGVLDMDTFDEATILPAIAILEDGTIIEPGALGGGTFNSHGYNISIYGIDPTHSRQIAEAIVQKLKAKIPVHDYTNYFPSSEGSPSSGELIGSFSATSIRNIRPNIPTDSILDSVRRDVSFEIIPFEK